MLKNNISDTYLSKHMVKSAHMHARPLQTAQSAQSDRSFYWQLETSVELHLSSELGTIIPKVLSKFSS